MVSCGGSLIKIVLGLFNCVVMLLGAFIIYLGVRIFQFNSADQLNNIINTNMNTGALVVVIFGAAIALIAFTGCFGAFCESALLLNIYGFVVLVILVLQCVGVYYGHTYPKEYEQKFEQGITSAIGNTFNSANPDKKLAYALQNIQNTLQCCGWTGPGDYKNLLTVPASCCAETVTYDKAEETCNRLSIKYSVGCKDSPVINLVRNSINISGYVLILVELILILAACCLARDLHSYQRVNTM